MGAYVDTVNTVSEGTRRTIFTNPKKWVWILIAAAAIIAVAIVFFSVVSLEFKVSVDTCSAWLNVWIDHKNVANFYDTLYVRCTDFEQTRLKANLLQKLFEWLFDPQGGIQFKEGVLKYLSTFFK